MKITRSSDPRSDRYRFDFGVCSSKNGYAQVDTKQDASYFGTWCSPSKRTIVCYCEGDITVSEAETDAELVAELDRMAEWNDKQGWGPMRIDPGLDPALRQAFVAIGAEHLLWPAVGQS